MTVATIQATPDVRFLVGSWAKLSQVLTTDRASEIVLLTRVLTSTETPTLQNRSAVSWSLSIHRVRRASLGRRKSSPSMPLHCHGIGRKRGRLLPHSTVDKRAERTPTQWNQGKWDLGQSRTGQGGPCTTNNGRRKCVRSDDSAVTFIKMDYVENN